MFWNKFQTLCKEKGVSPTQAAKELSISPGTVSEWKKGRVPQNSTIKKIAEYFNVSIKYLTNEDETTGKAVPVGPPLSAKDKEILEQLSYLTEDDKDDALRYIRFLRSSKT